MIAVYTLTSELHDPQTVERATSVFLDTLQLDYDYRGGDFAGYGSHPLSVIFVRTGGTEGIFRRLLPQLLLQSDAPFTLLTSGQSNSLAASMEILSFLRQQGLRGEIVHGTVDYMRRRLELLSSVAEARKKLNGCRLGIVGEPSDWLISSTFDAEMVKSRLGIELVKVPMEEVQQLVDETPIPSTFDDSLSSLLSTSHSPLSSLHSSLPGAERIYLALRAMVARYQLQGFTIRCFDLLTSVHNTGCLALAKLNAEGIVAGCEGDVPAMLSMVIGHALTGVSGFQCNPSRIDVETGEILLAHCTIPLNMVERYELDTHFESGIGVGIRGYMREGDVTLFKVSGDLSRSFIAEGCLVRNQAEPDLCRTQQVVRLQDAAQLNYFLSDPIGNHHVVFPGHLADALRQLM